MKKIVTVFADDDDFRKFLAVSLVCHRRPLYDLDGYILKEVKQVYPSNERTMTVGRSSRGKNNDSFFFSRSIIIILCFSPLFKLHSTTRMVCVFFFYGDVQKRSQCTCKRYSGFLL